MTAEPAPLRLKAVDQEDLVVLSSLLQDATVLVGDMGHDPETGRFMLVAARLDSASDGHGQRRLTGVHFETVSKVLRRGFSPEITDRVLVLLMITADTDGITLVFGGEHAVRLECQAIRVYAADLGAGWVTGFTPDHGPLS